MYKLFKLDVVKNVLDVIEPYKDWQHCLNKELAHRNR